MPPAAGDLAGARAGAEAERVFIGAGCNRVVNNVSWGACGLVAFGAGARAGAEAERVFIGAGCNRVVNNVSWGACGLVAFGAQNAVALFSPSRGEIVTTLPGHKAAVNCTLWLPTKKDVLQGLSAASWSND